jgi:DNA mismatch repair protein MutL
MTIKILDSKVISQIAAGEVVERPASAVKELIENSLDAGSTNITIETREGGVGLIRVADNGNGIPADEVEIAFERHATSKISSLKDLENLSSLGFRGEALPSIASVAEVEMTTTALGQAGGMLLRLEDGKVIRKEAAARPTGTTIAVNNLFRKVPARLKFLKSEGAESSRIADVVSHFVLDFPEVKFTLIAEGKTILRSSGSGRLVDSVLEVYGNQVARNMLPLGGGSPGWSDDADPIRVEGMVSAPQLSRSNRDYISFFVNRRWVSSRTLTWAIEEAYHGLLMQDKHPLAVINITLPSQDLDVNIHPAKTEIKFQNERSVFGAVQKAVRAALVTSAPVPQAEERVPRFAAPPAPPAGFRASPALKDETAPSARPSATPLISLPVLRLLGQVNRNYLAAEGPDGLYLIDQHAAHERILFEKIREQRSNRKVEVQGLLEPATLEIQLSQVSILQKHLADLAEFGFTLEPFGERTYLVRAIPALLQERDWRAALREILESTGSNWTESLMITMACHGAVRAGQVLSEIEMRELLHQLEQAALPHTCPHGRPTMIYLTIQQLEKEFGRR